MVYDISQRKSFDSLNMWKELIEDKCEQETKVLLIGNKIDLGKQRQVSTAEGKKFAQENDYFFMETSAKTNQKGKVGEAFDLMITHLGRIHIEKAQRDGPDFSNFERPTLPLYPVETKSKGCC